MRSHPFWSASSSAAHFIAGAFVLSSIALLASCGGSQVPVSGAQQIAAPLSSASGLASVREPLHRHKVTFNYTGAQQTFTVPGVRRLMVTASGASGANGEDRGGFRGGVVSATIPVTPGESLTIFVGGGGNNGGFNGGGGCCNFGGGGASDVRQGGSGLANRVVVAGGGGARGGYCGNGGPPGGLGGNLIGGAGGGGDNSGGQGGTQSSGGVAGPGGQSGSLGAGGGGARGGPRGAESGGGGGGGYYGGGGGGGGLCDHSAGGGGGGGSSYAEASATHVTMVQGGGAHANGKIVLSWR